VTAKDDGAATARFSAAASLKAAWKIGDNVTGKINLWFDPDAAALKMREAYFTYQVSDLLAVKGGKYIDHLGWLSAEPTGLYTVNSSLIGYVGNTYGNDVLGAALIITPKDSLVVGEIHVTNGYYTASDATSPGYIAPVSPNRQNSDMGYGFDLTFTPNEMVSVNLEGAYDTHSSTNAYNSYTGDTPDTNDNVLGGNVAMLGLNATAKPIKDVLLIGAEIQYLTVGTGRDAADQEIAGKKSLWQGMLLANYVLPETAFPMSVTGMIQHVSIMNDEEVDGAGGLIGAGESTTESSNAIQAALLTNPTGSSNFGLNLEVGYFQTIDSEVGNGVGDNAKRDSTGWATAVEALITF